MEISMPSRSLWLVTFLTLAFAWVSPALAQSGEHPRLFISFQEAEAIQEASGEYPFIEASMSQARRVMEEAFSQPIETPPPGEAGGYAHERHKQNYREMRWAGLLYSITGEARYAEFVRDMLNAYAELYPTLGPHPLAHNQAAGKLFHQTLNEAVWLVHTSIAYDCVYDFLSAEDRKRFEEAIFRPMAEWFSVHHAEQFDRIHNHGTWATAAVGMIGYVMDDQQLVDRALYGTEGNRTGGFLRQLDLLFSPDGYYMEGPYYIRYALMPFFYFAEAVARNQPEIGIYEYRDQILKKAYYAAVQTSFPNGVFPPINDASRAMDVAAPEVTLATDLVYDRYGADESLLGVATVQGRAILNGAGLALARDHAPVDEPPAIDWPSVEFTDGAEGEQGGLGILRAGSGAEASMLLMKYGVHGKGHGHFDKLSYIFFDGGQEVVPDYGFSRWINIEPKFGGRYLPENDSYAMQTVAHNTVVVDETSQNEAERDEAETMSGKRHFFDGGSDGSARVQAMSARADGYYPGVEMQRTMLLIDDDAVEYPVVVDLYRLTSDTSHQYDYPVHFRGQPIATSFDYEANTEALQPVGEGSGYQHLWQEAEATTDSTLRFSWLDGQRYYTFVSAPAPGTEVIMARTGAGDPNFNLQSEPLLLMRRQAADHLFATVIEPHGYFNEARERSRNPRSQIASVRVLGQSEEASVVEIEGKDGWRWQVMVNNGPASETKQHRVTFGGRTYEWTGNYHVNFETGAQASVGAGSSGR